MSFDIGTFKGDIALIAAIHKGNPNRAAELTAIATALGGDTTKHSGELETAPAGLIPGAATNTRFTNDILLAVNAGKSGNLTNAAMASAITTGIAQIIPPANTAAPVASGTGTVGQTLTTTNGTWTNSPTFTYQWIRTGVPISGANATTYVLVAADSGKSVACQVTGTNPAGTATATSNAIAVA